MLYAKHHSWEDGKTGFVTSVTEKKLVVQYHPGIVNVTNHFFVSVDEVIAGKWEIRWSSDLAKVYECILSEDTEQGEGEGKEENDT